jgi:hypothetical protein
VANTTNWQCNGAIGFIDWLDEMVSVAEGEPNPLVVA